MKQVQKLILLIALWLTLPLFLLLTNPETLSLPLLTIPFLLLAFSLYKTTTIGLGMFAKNMDQRRKRLIALNTAIFPTLLLILASIRQLTARDVAIVIALLVILTFYMKRIDIAK